jgi:hypothetical protein
MYGVPREWLRQATPSIYSPHNNSNSYTLEADSTGAPDSLSDDPNGRIPMARLNWPLAISGTGQHVWWHELTTFSFSSCSRILGQCPGGATNDQFGDHFHEVPKNTSLWN